jgi:hypothetical protein
MLDWPREATKNPLAGENECPAAKDEGRKPIETTEPWMSILITPISFRKYWNWKSMALVYWRIWLSQKRRSGHVETVVTHQFEREDMAEVRLAVRKRPNYEGRI